MQVLKPKPLALDQSPMQELLVYQASYTVLPVPRRIKVINFAIFVWYLKVSLLGTLQNIAGWDGMTEITSEGQFEMLERIKQGYVPC